MKFKPGSKILCPIDLSDYSEDVIDAASSLAAANGGKVYFVYVAIPELPASSGSAIAPVEEAVARERERFEAIRPTQSGVPYEHVFARGEPADEILRIADEINADLIVIGTHGRSGLTRMLMGSVAEAIVRRSAHPVLTIRTNKRHTQPA